MALDAGGGETNAHVTKVAAVEASDTFRKRRVFHAVQQVEGKKAERWMLV